jgi:hypothetical protein
MPAHIDDELLEQIAIVGPLDDVAARIHERYGKLAERISLVCYGIDDDERAALIPAIKNA